MNNKVKEVELIEIEKKDVLIYALEKRIKELENYIEGHQPFIKLEVYDRGIDTTHIVGTNPHDYLYVKNGVVQYYNLQNGCGTFDDYNFVEKEML